MRGLYEIYFEGQKNLHKGEFLVFRARQTAAWSSVITCRSSVYHLSLLFWQINCNHIGVKSFTLQEREEKLTLLIKFILKGSQICIKESSWSFVQGEQLHGAQLLLVGAQCFILACYSGR